MSEVAEVEDHHSMMDGQLVREPVGGEEAHEVGPIRQVGVAGGIGDVETVRQR